MKKIEEVTDVLLMVVPDDMPSRAHMEALLYIKSVEFLHGQYERFPEVERPDVKIKNIAILISSDPEEIDEFQDEDHDCDGCRQGSLKMREYLKEHPDASIACANIYYTEEI